MKQPELMIKPTNDVTTPEQMIAWYDESFQINEGNVRYAVLGRDKSGWPHVCWTTDSWKVQKYVDLYVFKNYSWLRVWDRVDQKDVTEQYRSR